MHASEATELKALATEFVTISAVPQPVYMENRRSGLPLVTCRDMVGTSPPLRSKFHRAKPSTLQLKRMSVTCYIVSCFRGLCAVHTTPSGRDRRHCHRRFLRSTFNTVTNILAPGGVMVYNTQGPRSSALSRFVPQAIDRSYGRKHRRGHSTKS